MNKKRKPKNTDDLLRKIREKLQAGNLFDPHEEAKKELLEATKEPRALSENRP